MGPCSPKLMACHIVAINRGLRVWYKCVGYIPDDVMQAWTAVSKPRRWVIGRRQQLELNPNRNENILSSLSSSLRRDEETAGTKQTASSLDIWRIFGKFRSSNYPSTTKLGASAPSTTRSMFDWYIKTTLECCCYVVVDDLLGGD